MPLLEPLAIALQSSLRAFLLARVRCTVPEQVHRLASARLYTSCCFCHHGRRLEQKRLRGMGLCCLGCGVRGVYGVCMCSCLLTGRCD